MITSSRFGLLLALSAFVVAEAGAAPAAAAPKRLDRFNLLEYRAENGKLMPVRSVRNWRRRRAEILAGAQDVMGPLPGPPKRVPLEVKIEEENEFGSYVRQRITYQAEPGSRVPAFLFIPKAVHRGDGSVQRPGVLSLMGTGGFKYEDIPARSLNWHDGEKLVARGLVVIAPAYPILGFGVVNAPMQDKWFPKWESVARIMAAALPVFRLYGVPDLMHVEYPDIPHEFPAEMRERAYDWLEQFL